MMYQEWPLKSKLDPEIYGTAESLITTELVEKEIRGCMTVDEVTYVYSYIQIPFSVSRYHILFFAKGTISLNWNAGVKKKEALYFGLSWSAHALCKQSERGWRNYTVWFSNTILPHREWYTEAYCHRTHSTTYWWQAPMEGSVYPNLGCNWLLAVEAC